jgi:hypothetical protein
MSYDTRREIAYEDPGYRWPDRPFGGIIAPYRTVAEPPNTRSAQNHRRQD